MITITTKAADKVKEIADAEALQGQGLRLGSLAAVARAFRTTSTSRTSPPTWMRTFEANGVNLYIDPLSYQYLEGTEIDYVEGHPRLRGSSSTTPTSKAPAAAAQLLGLSPFSRG